MPYKDKQKELEHNKKYRKEHPEQFKQYSKKWSKLHPIKRKRIKHKSYLKHKESVSQKTKKYRQNNKEKVNEWVRNWNLKHPIKAKRTRQKHRQTEKYKKYHTERKRKLGFNILYENPLDEQFEYHHINNNDVIAIPEDLHRLYNGRNKKEVHYFMCKEIIKQIYNKEEKL
jgi:hypothetical protein